MTLWALASNVSRDRIIELAEAIDATHDAKQRVGQLRHLVDTHSTASEIAEREVHRDVTANAAARISETHRAAAVAETLCALDPERLVEYHGHVTKFFEEASEMLRAATASGMDVFAPESDEAFWHPLIEKTAQYSPAGFPPLAGVLESAAHLDAPLNNQTQFLEWFLLQLQHSGREQPGSPWENAASHILMGRAIPSKGETEGWSSARRARREEADFAIKRRAGVEAAVFNTMPYGAEVLEAILRRAECEAFLVRHEEVLNGITQDMVGHNGPEAIALATHAPLEAMSGQPPQNETHRHLTRTFGAEIELVWPVALSQETRVSLVREACARLNMPVGTPDDDYQYIRIESDGSVRGPDPFDRELGTEVVTPVLHGEEGQRTYRKLLQAMSAIGATTNASTGGHFHVGALDFIGPAAYACQHALIQNYAANEPVLNAFVADHRRLGGYGGRPYAEGVDRESHRESLVRLDHLLTNSLNAEGTNAVSPIITEELGGRSKETKIRFAGLSGPTGTVEFRQLEGIIDPERGLDWLAAMQAMTNAAKDNPEHVLLLRLTQTQSGRLSVVVDQLVPKIDVLRDGVSAWDDTRVQTVATSTSKVPQGPAVATARQSEALASMPLSPGALVSESPDAAQVTRGSASLREVAPAASTPIQTRMQSRLVPIFENETIEAALDGERENPAPPDRQRGTPRAAQSERRPSAMR